MIGNNTVSVLSQKWFLVVDIPTITNKFFSMPLLCVGVLKLEFILLSNTTYIQNTSIKITVPWWHIG